jgi:dipeptidyl aminopeptidase/acylaminoacyl peptidase
VEALSFKGSAQLLGAELESLPLPKKRRQSLEIPADAPIKIPLPESGRVRSNGRVLAAAKCAILPMRLDQEIRTSHPLPPAISPDGRSLLIGRKRPDVARNERSEAWQIVTRGRAKPIGMPDMSDPMFSPDGTKIAFAATDPTSGRTQLYVQSVDGQAPVRVTDLPDGVRTYIPDGAVGAVTSWYAWSPSGDRLYFIADRAKTRSERTQNGRAGDAFFVFEGANGQIWDRWSAVYEVPITGGKPRAITSGKQLLFDLAVSPDGKRLAVVRRGDNVTNQGQRAEVAVVDLATGKTADVTSNASPEYRVRWHPNGREISFLSVDDREWELKEPKVWAVDVETKQQRLLSGAFGGHIFDYAWSEDGARLLIHGGVRTNQGLFAIDPAIGAVSPLYDKPGCVEDAAFSADGKTAVITWSDSATPPESYLVALDGSRSEKRLTSLNRHLDHVTRARAETVRWNSPDGQEVEGLLLLPPGGKAPLDAPLPTVLHLHGGPRGTAANLWSGDLQLLAAQGYAVLAPNVRGSEGYGDAWLRGNLQDIGGKDLEDALSGVDALVARGIADPGRLAVRGWSYGGVLGGFAITKSERFKAASLGAMVADWTSEYAAGFNHDIRRWYIGGTPQSNPSGYRERSPLTHVANVTTPTILFHGEADRVDSPAQSMSFFTALRELGVPTRLMMFPGEGHTVRRPKHRRARLEAELDWLNQHVLGEAGSRSTR